MFELIFLGTSASAPSAHRGLPAQIIKHNEHRYLVDALEQGQTDLAVALALVHLTAIRGKLEASVIKID